VRKLNLKPNPTPFAKRNYKDEANLELKNNREINAFLLIYSYIEAYLRELTLLSGNRTREDFTDKIIKQFDRLNFPNLILFNLLNEDIDVILYCKLLGIHEFRNKLAHEFITIDVTNKNTLLEIKRVAQGSILICDEVFKAYEKLIKKRTAVFDPKIFSPRVFKT